MQAPVPRLRNVQAALSSYVGVRQSQQLWTRILAIVDEQPRLRAMAWRRSQLHPCSQAYLAVLPTAAPGGEVPAPALREAIRRNLGILQPETGGYCSGENCNHRQSGHHAQHCNHSGYHMYRHERVKAAFRTEFKAIGLQVVEESHAPFPDHPTLRMDLVVPGGQMLIPAPMDVNGATLPGATAADLGKAALVDIYLADPTSATAIQRFQSAVKDGGALIQGSQVKHTRYGGKFPTIENTLITCGLEIGGRLFRPTDNMLKTAAKHEAARSDGASTYSSCMARWRQRISVALQRAISESVSYSVAQSRAIPGQALDIGAYRRVRLLKAREPGGGGGGQGPAQDELLVIGVGAQLDIQVAGGDDI